MTLILLSFIVFFAHFIGALTGFGATVLALPFTISLIGINNGKPMLIVLGFLQCLVVAIQQFKNINWREVKKVVIIVSLGMPIGLILYKILPKDFLLNLLSIFMLIVSIKGFMELKGYKFQSLSNFTLNSLLFSGGIIHGAFVSGGPLLMIYSSETIKDKNIFRASMSMIWVILNGFLMIDSIISKVYTPTILTYTVLTLPALFLGIFLAGKLSDKVNQRMFNFTIYTVLAITAIFNLI
ncbi:MAG: TSUP family transporter [Peptostreptococcaceae bacterium]